MGHRHLLCMRLVTGTTASSLFRPRMPSVRGSKLLAQGRTARWWGGWHSRSGGSAARARAPDDGVPAPHPSKAGPLPSAAAPPPSTGPKTLQLQSCCAPYCHQSCRSTVRVPPALPSSACLAWFIPRVVAGCALVRCCGPTRCSWRPESPAGSRQGSLGLVGIFERGGGGEGSGREGRWMVW